MTKVSQMVNRKKEIQQRCHTVKAGAERQAGQSGHRVTTHIRVLGHRVQLKKQRALDYLAHLEEGRMHTRVRAHLPSPHSSRLHPNMYLCEHVYLLMDVNVGGVRRPSCGIPTQKLQLLEYLFNWRERGQNTQYIFKSSFFNLKLLVCFYQLLPFPSWLHVEQLISCVFSHSLLSLQGITHMFSFSKVSSATLSSLFLYSGPISLFIFSPTLSIFPILFPQLPLFSPTSLPLSHCSSLV